LKLDIQDFVCEKNKISISWYMSGTQIGDIPDLLPAAGKEISASGLTIYYFSEGKISGHWQVFDRLTFLEQLGVKIGRS
jgi:predicted ester cyclase